MALTGSILIQVRSELSSSLDFSTPSDLLQRTWTFPISDGAGANQCNQHWHDQRAIGTAGESLDLAGVLTNGLGQTVTFARVKAIIIAASSANTGNVQVGGAAATVFVNWVADATDKINVRPGQVFVLTALDATGFAVGAGTSDLLKVAAAAGTASVTYDVILLGATS